MFSLLTDLLLPPLTVSYLFLVTQATDQLSPLMGGDIFCPFAFFVKAFGAVAYSENNNPNKGKVMTHPDLLIVGDTRWLPWKRPRNKQPVRKSGQGVRESLAAAAAETITPPINPSVPLDTTSIFCCWLLHEAITGH